MSINITRVCSLIKSIIPSDDLMEYDIDNEELTFYEGKFKIRIIYEKVDPFNQMSRIAIIYYYINNSQNEEEFICNEEFGYKFIFMISPEERCISKIYDSKGELYAYKYCDRVKKYEFYVYLKISKTMISLTTQNCSLTEIIESIREMEIRKINYSMPSEFSQRKKEMMVIMHAYQIFGKKKNCYILQINNNNQIYGRGYFNSSKYKNVDQSKINDLFINDLGLYKHNIQGITFIVLPLKLYHHCSIILISLEDKKLYLLDSCYNEQSTKDIFGQFQITPLIDYVIQINYTCAYFMEAMCIVLTEYDNISDIIKECKSGIFVVKTFVQIGRMFEPENNQTVIYPCPNDKRYQEITIHMGKIEFKYGLKIELFNQKFFNFDNSLEKIDPESQFKNRIYSIKKLKAIIKENIKIENILNIFYEKVDQKLNLLLDGSEYENYDQSEKQKYKQEIQKKINECQLQYKEIFRRIIYLFDFFKKKNSIVTESIDYSVECCKNEVEGAL